MPVRIRIRDAAGAAHALVFRTARGDELAANLQQTAAAVGRAARLIDDRGAEPGGAALAPGPGQIEFHDVHFGYTPEHEVLAGLTLTIPAGSVTALVGPSGANGAGAAKPAPD